MALFAKICARFQSSSVSPVSEADVNKDVWIMHDLSGIGSGLFLNVLNSQDWLNVTIFEHYVIVIFWPQSISLINFIKVYVDEDNVDVYVEIFLSIINGS